jgi:hypothetical protein
MFKFFESIKIANRVDRIAGLTHIINNMKIEAIKLCVGAAGNPPVINRTQMIVCDASRAAISNID